MIKVTLVGRGTVSKHLMRVFSNTPEIELIQVLPSRTEALSKSLKFTPEFDKIDSNEKQPDLYIIAVSDDAIAAVSKHFQKSNKLLVHTSGSVALDVLPNGVRRGVFYPLQTFSKERKIDFKNVPICVEAESQSDLEILKKVATAVTKSVYEISTEQRKSLHLAAVFANNFTNHIYHISSEICQKNKVPFDILKPLIAETTSKINALSPFDAQTGPAKRNDQETIETQLNQLLNERHKEVYKILTNSIKETYGEKL